MKTTAILLLIIGVVVGIFGLAFDTTIDVDGVARVHNIGLLEERRLILGAAALALVLGALLFGFSSLRQRTSPPSAELQPQDIPLSQIINRFRSGSSVTSDELVRLSDQSERESRITTIVAHDTGNTLLHVAAKAGNLAAIRSLLRSGIDRTTKNKQGLLAIDLAATDSVRRVLSDG